MTTAARLAPTAGAAVALGLSASLALLALGTATGLRDRWPEEADILLLPSADVLRLGSLGHVELAADLVAARTNVYYGMQVGKRGRQQWLSKYLATIFDLDARFHRMYEVGAAMLVYTGRTMTVDGILEANHLLERGMREFPGDWNLKFQHGFNYFFELPNIAGSNDPRVPHWRQLGVESLRQASLYDGIPTWLPNLVARLLTRQGSLELAIRSLEQSYAAATNPETREQIRRKLVTLKGQRYAEDLGEESARFAASLTLCPAYVPEALCILLGPPPAPGIDLRGLTAAAPPPPASETR